MTAVQGHIANPNDLDRLYETIKNSKPTLTGITYVGLMVFQAGPECRPANGTFEIAAVEGPSGLMGTSVDLKPGHFHISDQARIHVRWAATPLSSLAYNFVRSEE